MNPTTEAADYMSEQEVSEFIGMAPATLRKWRGVGKGPSYILITRGRVKYLRADVTAWMEGRYVDHKAGKHMVLPIQRQQPGVLQNHRFGRRTTKFERGQAN